MVRTQIQLTEEQSEALRQLASARGVSLAAIVREAVDRLLRAPAEPSRRELLRRTLEYVGAFDSGVTDVSRNHDRYFVESILGDDRPG